MIAKPPTHLRPATKAWFASVCTDYDLEPHHVRLLTLAAESWDRCCEAREALAKHGLTFVDRYGSPRARPEAAIESQSRIAFCRLCRELDLDTEATPDSKRPPALHSNRRG
jgi:phage terminase small subunit